jgi:murein DD-endopeptidase MepM/ murein hydrolase activator NlpD
MVLRRILCVAFLVICAAFAISCSKGEADTNAYIVKIDGKEVGYVESESEVSALVEKLSSEKKAELDALDTEVIRISVNSRIEGVPALCDGDEIETYEQLVDKYYKNGGKISFSVTVSEKETKYISFETVYNNSSSYYEGTKVVKTNGVQGEKELTYEVTYVDGSESSRSLVTERVTKEPVNEVVLVGTKKSTASTGKYAWPLKSVAITSSYGNRYLNGKYNFHLGVDLRASNGTSVYAADGGKVTFAGYSGSYGYLIKILHDNGDYTYYAHLSKISVSVGSRVYKGQLIGKSGATGNVTGPHLHFEIRKNGSTVNPVSYLPSMRGVIFVQNAYPESCLVQTRAYLSHSARPAFSSSKREQEEYPLPHHP